MAVQFNQEKQIITLHTKNTSYQMKITDHGFLQQLYYGGRIQDDDMSYRLKFYDVGFSGNPHDLGTERKFSLDTILQEYPSAGVGDYRVGCLEVVNTDGSYAADLRYVSHAIKEGKYSIPGMPALYDNGEEAQTLEITLKDAVTSLTVILYYGIFEKQDIITRSAKIINKGDGAIALNKALSLSLDLPFGDWELLHFHGRHSMERNAERVPVMHGVRSIGSTRGTSSHHHNPLAILCDPETTETHGSCYGVSLIYSGGFQADIEMDQLNQTRLVMGIQSQQFSYNLQPGEAFDTPEAVLTYSDKGLEPLSHNYHYIYRHNLCRGKYKLSCRPILINNWEATYFDFNTDKLLHIARDAAVLGIEMLVLDDGWFGKREGDICSLGDWKVNLEKLPGGLSYLVSQVNSMGLKFGIWFEPEMVSEDSDLYRTHPEWTLKIPGRNPARSRYQLVLDMSRQDVRDYLYKEISAVLDSANIEYVKWDMNRSLSDVYSSALEPSRQGEVHHRYILGLYDLLEKLTASYPDVLFEGCSGGGGRFDPAMLYYSPQIWCSDNTDAIERIKIQYGTSFAYPISTVGSHVSACPNHQTNRIVPFTTRGVTAMAGSFGYELDLTKLTIEESQIVKLQVEEYKKYQPLIHNGHYHRLTDPFQNQAYAAWQFTSEDQNTALINFVRTRIDSNGSSPIIFPRGLDPQKKYQAGDYILSGAALMKGGITISRSVSEYESVQFEINAVE